MLRKPLHGNRNETHECGQVVQEHLAPWHTTSGTTSVVADSALYSADTLQKLAKTQMQWSTRVPATLGEAHAALAHAAPQTMRALPEGSRYHALTSTSGGGEQRWLLIASEPRQSQAKRSVDTHLCKHSDQEVKALKKLCGTAFACEADARQALACFAHGLQATFLHESTLCATPRYGKRGRPSQDAQPDHMVSHIAGALASR